MDNKQSRRTPSDSKNLELLACRRIYHHTSVGIARVSLDSIIVHTNPAYGAILGYTEKELAGKALSEITHPADIEASSLNQQKMAAGTIDHYKLEKRYLHRDGHTVYGILDANLVRDEDGRPAYCIGTMVDITELKNTQQKLTEAFQERNTLLKELKHRVKNSFTSLYTLANLELKQTDNHEAHESLQKLMQRMRTFSQLYSLLDYSEGDSQKIRMDRYLAEITRSVEQTVLCDNAGITVEKTFDDIRLDMKQASPWGLILNELLTNAFKYAFSGAGRIDVSFRKMPGSLVLEVRDNGTGLPEDITPETSTGLGFMLVRTLADQLEAECSIAEDSGLVCRITAPDAG